MPSPQKIVPSPRKFTEDPLCDVQEPSERSRHTFGDEAFCFLPDSFVQAEKPICFLEDRIISPPQEIEAMEHREAEFFHS